MARLRNNHLPIQGKIGTQIVLKQYGDKTVVTAYPDMSQVKPSPLQKDCRSVFKEAIAYAKGICNQPDLKRQYQDKVPAGRSVYHFAISEYMAKHKEERG